MDMEGHANLTDQSIPVEHEHEMGDVAEDEDPQRPGPLSGVDAQFRVRRLEQLLYSISCVDSWSSRHHICFRPSAATAAKLFTELSAYSGTLT